MAKTKGPLHSLDASGTIADQITFSKWLGIKKAGKKNIPTNPRTSFQQDGRYMMSGAVQTWQNMSQGDKNIWNDDAALKKLQMSGYNYYLSQYILNRGWSENLPIMEDLYSWWKCNEGAGALIVDSINAKNFAFTNPAWTAGHDGLALDLNGVDRYGVQAANILWKTVPFSVEFWFYYAQLPTVSGIGGTVLQARAFGSPYNAWYINISNVYNRVEWHVLGDGAPSGSIDFQNQIPAGVWHHVVCTIDGSGNMKAYLDSILEADTASCTNLYTCDQDFSVGARGDGVSPMLGLLDTIRFYQKALTQAEVDHNYNL